MSEHDSKDAPWPWPDSPDALAAPQHHILRLENGRVRVIETRIPPGEIVALHTHRWPGVLHVLAWSHFIRRDQDAVVTLDTRATSGTFPPVLWAPPIELKDPAG
ncbi:hypothetical protein BH09PLA1_BH09PLA1_37430 [soil metagenome]